MKAVNPGHEYELDNVDGGSQTLQFIEKEAGTGDAEGTLVTKVNGTTTEQVISAVIDRLQTLSEKLPDDFTKDAIQHLEAALLALQNRTADREQRGVEGTEQA